MVCEASREIALLWFVFGNLEPIEKWVNQAAPFHVGWHAATSLLCGFVWYLSMKIELDS